MREILFRGKNESGKWVEGYYVRADWYLDGRVTHCIFPIGTTLYPHCEHSGFESIVPDTIGQYTGLTDKNETKIFEGDIVNYNGTNHKVVFETRGESAYFGIEISNIETWRFCLEVPAKLMNVIGNIYDNPELLRSDTE